MAIVGHFEVPEIVTDTVERLWAVAGRQSSLAKDDFFAYFGDARVGSAWRVSSPTPLRESLPLDEIRQYDPRYTPPQSMEYLSEGHAALNAMCERGLWPMPRGPAR